MSKKLLIIEDNMQNMYMMQFLLERHGFIVYERNTGEAGISAAAELQPDAILLDIQLPCMDGYTVTRRLKELPETAGIPVIVVTSFVMTGDREQSMAAGASGYIEKPIDPETFIDTMLSFLPQEDNS